MSTEAKMAPFEREVAERIRDGKDYWFGNKGRVGSRGPAQALNRLKKKGFVYHQPGPDEYKLSLSGKLYLENCK